MGGPSYTRIPGSERLKTGKRGVGPAAGIEGADRASVARAVIDIDAEGGPRRLILGRVLLRGASLPLLHDVVDRLFPLLQAEEVTVYIQLYRLAVDVDKNVCRVSRTELTRRTRLADRRLGRAVAGLVARQAIVLVDRNRDGTLYRVMFPDEILDMPPPTVAKKKTAPKDKGAQPVTAVVAAAPEAPLSSTSLPPASMTQPRSVGDVCSWFAARYGTGRGRSGTDVATLVLDLLEEGHTFREIPTMLEAFMIKAPKTTPLRDLLRVLSP